MDSLWTAKQRKWIHGIAVRWAAGDTLSSIAKRRGLVISTLQRRLASLGVELVRPGKMVWASTKQPVDWTDDGELASEQSQAA